MGLNNILIQKRKQKRFNIITGNAELTSLIDRLPEENECFKFVSEGGFSSICFIMFVAQRAVINNLYVSSFRVGKKEAQVLHALKQKGRLQQCRFMLSSFASDEKSSAFNSIETICGVNGWTVDAINNHSKVHLYDTDKGKFVIETSSNLNENPRIEQFSFEKDVALYEFYRENMFEKALKG